MKHVFLVLMASCLAASASTEDQINKRFDAQPGGRIEVDIDFGGIAVVGGASNEVTVSVYRKVSRRSESAEVAFLTNHPVTITQEGSTVRVESHSISKLNASEWFSSGSSEGRYVITVPAQFAAKLNTAGGGIKVSNFIGNTEVHTSGGGLDFVRVQGPINGSTSGGGIRADDCEGAIRITTSGGGIRVHGGSGSLEGGSSGGGVTVAEFKGAVRVHTSGGGIDIENVAGDIDGSTSGGGIKVGFASAPASPARLTTSGGSITASLPEKTAFNLDAATSAGKVSTDFPVTTVVKGKQDSGSLRGTVNGGGPELYLRTSGGGIHIKQSSAAR